MHNGNAFYDFTRISEGVAEPKVGYIFFPERPFFPTWMLFPFRGLAKGFRLRGYYSFFKIWISFISTRKVT